METKKCFKCGEVKPLNDFYKHPKMGDGYLGKCKECAKSDVKKKYEKNVQIESYVEKERLRGRVKYAKYKYKSTGIHSNATLKLKSLGFEMQGKESHHWNYNLDYDVFILSRRAHSLVHKYITLDKPTKLFRYNGGMLIESKKEHYEIILCIFKENNVNYEIEVYPIPF